MRAHSTRSDLEFSLPQLETRPEARPFTRIVTEMATYVFGLLHRLGVASADVPDVAQEVFLAVHEQRSEFAGRSSLKTWICGISVRKAADYRRMHARHQRRMRALAAEPPRAQTDLDPSLPLEAAQRVRALRNALDHLTDKERNVFVLYELEELTMAQVAAAIGCPRFTAYTRLHAARKRMRAALATDPMFEEEP